MKSFRGMFSCLPAVTTGLLQVQYVEAVLNTPPALIIGGTLLALVISLKQAWYAGRSTGIKKISDADITDDSTEAATLTLKDSEPGITLRVRTSNASKENNNAMEEHRKCVPTGVDL